ncbi:hypothetical protein Q7C36_003951 [Tachysurus vachellii]|uniref:Uncharacterized protein n=1 Tax=Tachysurus vachellii TaxID=175792 RepID=A0AA88NQZ9_TACVA|nr:uncharacterized protein LOC132842168 [Tachysurus vachellii]KAK2864797.1 hypothetical protein Q7C36_003951 [Tachysurus vachellii]
MSRPTPHLPHVSDSSCWSSETEISQRFYRSSRGSGGKSVPCPLGPVPLFRSIGLTGLSASLPPHRRLRSVLHRARAVRPDNANANETDRARGGSDANRLVSEATDTGLPFKDFLPDIMTPTPRPPSQSRETRTRESRSIGNVETFSSLWSQAESSLNPSFDLVDTLQRRHSVGHQDPPSKIYASRRTVVFPLTSTETPAHAGRKRWSRRIRQIWTSEKSSDEQDISEYFHSLVITDNVPSANTKHPQTSGSPKSNRSDVDSEREGKGACHTRRDRRPHFLPPISQSGCLLDVPFILPENSPPPSPSSTFSTPFFPLCVPALPVFPQNRQRDT